MAADEDHESAHEDAAPHAGRDRGEMLRHGAHEAKAKAEFILSRCYGLLKNPDSEWEQIRSEQTNIPSILIGYVAPLAAIPPLCGVIGSYIFGNRYGAEIVRPALDTALIGAVLSFVISIALIFLLGILINAVAENFDADRNEIAAQKVAAYAMTPAFLSGIFSLWPPIWWLSIIALAASAFLLYRGLPILMRTPEDRALGYASMVGVAGLVAFIILFSVTSCVAGAGRI
jgi:hypothetical protein